MRFRSVAAKTTKISHYTYCSFSLAFGIKCEVKNFRLKLETVEASYIFQSKLSRKMSFLWFQKKTITIVPSVEKVSEAMNCYHLVCVSDEKLL